MENKKLLLKIGKILYEIYDIHNYNISRNDFNRLAKYIYDALNDIQPQARVINPDIIDFVDATNRRYKDEGLLL